MKAELKKRWSRQRKTKLPKLFCFIYAIVLVVLLPVGVFAAQSSLRFKLDDKAYAKDVRSDAEKFAQVIKQDVYADVGEKQIGNLVITDETALSAGDEPESGLFLGSNDKGYYFNGVVFESLPAKEQKSILKSFVADLNTVKLSPEGMSYVYQNIQDVSPSTNTIILGMGMDLVKPNMFSALKVLKPFQSPLGLILGLISAGALLSVTITTLIDMFVMLNPRATEFALNKGEQNGDNRPKWITLEAWSAIKEATDAIDKGDGGYKATLVIYAKRRVLMIVVFMVSMLYLVFGCLGDVFITWFSSLQGLIK